MIKKMIRVVFFDLCDVLITDPMDVWYASVKQSHGLERMDAYHKVKDLFDAFEEGRLDEQTYWGLVADRLNTPKEKSAEWQSLSYSDLRLLKDVLPILEHLKEKKVRFGIISNTSKEWGAHFLSKVLPPVGFEPVVLSCSVGKKKPHLDIFHEAKRLSGVANPGELLFLDDRQKHVDAATSAGWDAQVVTNPDEIRSALQIRGLW